MSEVASFKSHLVAKHLKHLKHLKQACFKEIFRGHLIQGEPVLVEGVHCLWPVELSHAAEDLLDVVEQVDPAVRVVVLLGLDRQQGAHTLLREVNLPMPDHLMEPFEFGERLKCVLDTFASHSCSR